MSRSVTVVATAIGGRKLASTIEQSPALLGYETARQRPPRRHAVEFCDYPFSRESATFADHLEAVEREQPRLAVAPDVEAGRDPATVYAQADELAKHAQTVVVVPKDVHPGEVPDRFRVGVPLASFGSDAGWQWGEYERAGEHAGLHLLGGTPHEQLDFAQRVDGVRSVDGAGVFKGAQMGNVWAPSRSRRWHPTGDQMGYYERVSASLANVAEAWRVYGADERGEYTTPVERERWEEHAAPAIEEVEHERRYQQARGRPTIRPQDADCVGEEFLADARVVDFDNLASMAEREALDEAAPDHSRATFDDFGEDDDTDPDGSELDRGAPERGMA